MRAKIRRNQVALPVIGKLFARDNLQAAKLWITARTDAVQLAPHFCISEKGCAGKSVVDSLAARAVGDKRLAERIEVVTPRIAKTFQKNVEFHRGRTQMINAAAVQSHDTIRRF